MLNSLIETNTQRKLISCYLPSFDGIQPYVDILTNGMIGEVLIKSINGVCREITLEETICFRFQPPN